MAATTKRKAAPRKGTATAAQNGHTNGHSVAEVAAPELFESAPQEAVKDEAPAATHPYGNKQVYSYQPKDGSSPIVFPAIIEVNADAYFFWKIYDMNEMFQAFEWMKKADVPRDIQSRVMLLDDAEKAAFFAGWFNAVTAPQGVTPPGES